MLRSLNIHARKARPGAAAVVAFQAQSKDHRPPQEAPVGRSMRIVARLAAFDHGGRMLIHEGSAPVAVALHTGFIVERGLFHHGRPRGHAPGSRERAMRIVAIPAIHEAFVDAMLGGHFELRAHACVARKAGLAARLREQEFRARRMMDGMAIGAGNAVQGVLGALDVGFLKVLRVAGETDFHGLFGVHQRERVADGGLSAMGRHVFLPRTVAAFASGQSRRPVARGHCLIVRVLIEGRPHVHVAGLTGVAPHKTGGRRRRLCHGRESRQIQTANQQCA